MKLNLTKPLIVFDLETTGLDLVNDHIIQISYIKVYPDGKEERENIFVNPGISIPEEVTPIISIFLCLQKNFCVPVLISILPIVG